MQVGSLPQISSSGASSQALASPASAGIPAGTAPLGSLTAWGIFRSILREQGPMGLFRGVSINYIKAVPSTAIGFTIYDQLK